MAAEGVLPFANKTKPKHRTLGWLTIRRSRKNKYNLQDASPNCYLHPDDGPLANGVVDEDDIPKLVERLHLMENEPTHLDPQIVITTQKHLIDALRRENGALRLLRYQVDLLRKENTELKKDVDKLKSKKQKNGLKIEENGEDHKVPETNGKDTGATLRREASEEHLVSLRMENEKLRKSNDQLQSCLEEHKKAERKQNGSRNGLTNGDTHRTETTNGMSSEDEVEDRQNGRLSPRSNGVGEDRVDGKTSRPTLKKGSDNGAGTSGTSLVSVNCLRKVEGSFHDCDEILEQRLKSHMAAKGVDLVLNEWSPGRDHHMVTLVHCVASNDATKNIKKALDGVSSDAEIVLVVFHTASQDAKRKDPETESLSLPELSNACLVVDVFFSKKDSLYRCNQNNKAMSRLLHLFEMIC
ncbi:uncharacterized protein LOC117300748 [Asterias rubens]|uniref:uncharacterized protein LOC117300748 n=1 Tax=Asterias rubens TaxID=7604 RepID=UPI0014553A7D|nr:uncharacterized protein LOC117300748 [Asterias rubens]